MLNTICTHSCTKGMKKSIFSSSLFYNMDKKKKNLNQQKQITCPPPGLLFVVCCSLINRHEHALKVSRVTIQHTATEDKSSCRRVTWVRKLFSLGPPVEHLIRFLLRLMYDVSIEPLSQNRTKPFSCDRHVLSIWTLPAPHGLSFQFHSTAAMPQN